MENETTALAKAETRGPIMAGNRGLQLTTIDDMWRFAQFVSVSGMCPKGLEKPESLLVAIQLGAEIGLSPMQAIQNIYVVRGRPTVFGDALKALVLSSGLCVSFEETFEGKPYQDDFAAVCTSKRKGFPNPSTQRFSVAMAKKAGLWDDPDKQYKRYPDRMLQMRARSWLCRDLYADVLKGVISKEEVEDYIDAKAVENTEALRSEVKRQRATAPSPTARKPIVHKPAVESVDPDTGEILGAEPVAQDAFREEPGPNESLNDGPDSLDSYV